MSHNNVQFNNFQYLSIYKKQKLCRNEHSLKEKLPFFQDYRDHFTNYYANEVKRIKKEYKGTEANNRYNALRRTWEKINNFVTIAEIIVTSKVSIREYFKGKGAKMSRSSFTAFQHKMTELSDRQHDKIWDVILHNPIPKNPKKKYTKNQEQQICNYVDKLIKNNEIKNYLDGWAKIRKEGKINQYGDFSTLSLKKYRQVLADDDRFAIFRIKQFKPRHKFRKFVPPIGKCQFDLKILGLKETNVNKMIPVLDVKCTATRITYSEVLEDGRISTVLAVLKMQSNILKVMES